MREKQIQNEVIRAFGTRPELRLWRQNTGVARMGKRVVRFGIPGQADLTGIAADGRRLEIEIKSDIGVQSNDQCNFQAMIVRFGGIYILARSVADVEQALQAAGVIL